MVREVTDRDFDRVVEQAGLPVLVEFWKPGCGSCRALMRELQKLELDVTGKVLTAQNANGATAWAAGGGGGGGVYTIWGNPGDASAPTCAVGWTPVETGVAMVSVATNQWQSKDGNISFGGVVCRKGDAPSNGSSHYEGFNFGWQTETDTLPIEKVVRCSICAK